MYVLIRWLWHSAAGMKWGALIFLCMGRFCTYPIIAGMAFGSDAGCGGVLWSERYTSIRSDERSRSAKALVHLVSEDVTSMAWVDFAKQASQLTSPNLCTPSLSFFHTSRWRPQGRSDAISVA